MPKCAITIDDLFAIKNVSDPQVAPDGSHIVCTQTEAARWSRPRSFLLRSKRSGAPVELMRYPNESRDTSRNGQPKHRKERLAHIARWFKKYL